MTRLPSFDRPHVLAHRMLVTSYPENTILSLKQACELGVDWIEFDVKVLQDGAMVSMHDSTVNRTTDGTGDITQMTLKEVKELNAGKGYDFGFVPVPTVEEIFQTMSEYSPTLKAEMHIHNLYEPEKLVPLLDKYGLRKRCYFNLNAYVIAEYFRQDVEDSESLISLNVSGNDPKLRDLCNELDISYLCVSVKGLNEAFVDEVHAYRTNNPVFIHTYPVQDEEKWQKMIDIGADVIQTDFPEALMEYLDEKGY